MVRSAKAGSGVILGKANSLVNSVLHLHRRDDLRFTDIAEAAGLTNRATQVALNTLCARGAAERHQLAGTTIYRPVTAGLEGRAMRLLAVAAMSPETLFDSRELSKIRYVGLFGSIARGAERKDSDIDVLIVGKPDRDKVAQALRVWEKRYGRIADPSVYSSTEFAAGLVDNAAYFEGVFREILPLFGDMPDVQVAL